MQICNLCSNENPKCLMYNSEKGDEKFCLDCYETTRSKEIVNNDDASKWWKIQAENHFKKKKINNAAIMLQQVWKKYLRSDLAKYYWCERMLYYEKLPENYFTDSMLKYMEKIIDELNNPPWTGSVKDFDQLSWMLDNLEIAQGAYKTLPSWWNWTDIRNKTDPVIWSDYSDSSDSE